MFKKFRFIVGNPNDEIQKYWVKNEFYEQEELNLIKKHIPPNSTILDVGANVGNHSIWFEYFLDPKEIIIIEPNQRAFELMLMNFAFNYIKKCNLEYLGLGLGSSESYSDLIMPDQNNSGTAYLKINPSGTTKIVTGDSLFYDTPIDFIKIDVESMEMEVLKGLSKTINKYKPIIFIEIDNKNEFMFSNWLQDNNYFICESFQRYSVNKNHLIKARG